MAEDLQGLLERINEEGIKKTEAHKDKILADARSQAAKIVADANDEAARIVADAKREQATLVHAGEDKLRQSARDIKISLEAEIKQMLQHLVRRSVTTTMKPDFLAELIIAMAQAYAGQKGAVASADVLIPRARQDELQDYLKAELASHFSKGVTIQPVPGIDAGIQVSFNGESVFHDFTDDAITEMLCAYANPHLVAMLRGEKGS